MAKFNTYGVHTQGDDGVTILETQLTALSLESAWHKAVEAAFDAKEPGDIFANLQVYRIKSPSESHG